MRLHAQSIRQPLQALLLQRTREAILRMENAAAKPNKLNSSSLIKGGDEQLASLPTIKG
jgi:hypothetical protein